MLAVQFPLCGPAAWLLWLPPGFFIGLLLEASEADANILAGGFDGFYTYFASDATSFGSHPDNWEYLAK